MAIPSYPVLPPPINNLSNNKINDNTMDYQNYPSYPNDNHNYRMQYRYSDYNKKYNRFIDDIYYKKDTYNNKNNNKNNNNNLDYNYDSSNNHSYYNDDPRYKSYNNSNNINNNNNNNKKFKYFLI